MALAWVPILVVTAIFLYVIDHLKRNVRYKDIKGPSHWLSLPLVGHAYLLGKDVDGTLKKYQKKFGNIFRFDVGNIPTVILCDFATIQEAFKMDAFNGRTEDDNPTMHNLVRKGIQGDSLKKSSFGDNSY